MYCNSSTNQQIGDASRYILDMFEATKTPLWEKIIKIVGSKILGEWSTDAIYRLYQHPILTGIVFNDSLKCKKYVDKYCALASLHKGSFMVFIKEIRVYCIFDDMSEFRQMVIRIYSNMADCKNPDICMPDIVKDLKFTPYQIFFSNEKQKIVMFAFSKDDNIIEEVRRRCEKFFEKNVTVNTFDDGFMLTIDKEVNNFNEAREMINRFRDDINTFCNDISDKIRFEPPYEMCHMSHKYIMFNIEGYDSFDTTHLNIDVTKMLKSIPSGHEIKVINVVNNVMVNSNNNSNNHITNTNSNNIIKPRSKFLNNPRCYDAEKWIKSRLPSFEMGTVEYYVLYKESLCKNEKPIKMDRFNDLVTLNGYEKIKDGIHKWRPEIKK